MRDSGPLVRPVDLLVALSLLTRLPLRLHPGAYARGARTAWAWPLVGFMVGALACTVVLIAQKLGFPAMVAALFALATMTVVTGAMHEDGLADCADGFWGGHDPAQRLDIMKDSQIGTYGVLALILLVLLRWAALMSISQPSGMLLALLAAAVISRTAMAAVMQLLPNARGSGLSAETGVPGTPAVLIACTLATLFAFVLVGPVTGLAALLVAAAIAAFWARIARGKIGGQTGDVLGATQQLTDTGLLMFFSLSL